MEARAGRQGWWSRDRGSWYLVVGLVCVAAGLRILTLYRNAFWVDELDELTTSANHIGSVMTTRDGFPPLSSLLDHVWLWFGSFETVRWLAVAYGLGAVVLLALAAARIGGRRAGVIALAIGAFSPLLIWYSQELRPYSLLMLVAAASLLALLRAVESGRRSDWMVYAVISALGLWTQYFYALTVGAAVIWLWLRRRSLGNIRPAVEAHVLIFVLALPLLALVWGDVSYQATYQASNATAEQSSFGLGALGYTIFSFFSGYSLGPSLRALHDQSLGAALRSGWPWVLLFAVLVIPLSVWAIRRSRRDYGVRLLVALVVIPIAVAGLLSVVADVGFRPRYVSWCVVPLVVLAAVAIDRLDRSWFVVAMALVLGASGWAYANRHFNAAYRTEDMREAARLADQIDPTGEEPMFVAVDYMAPLAVYYSRTDRPVIPVPPIEAAEGELEAAVTLITDRAGGDSFFLVYTRAFHGDTEGRLLNHLELHDHLALERELAGVRLYRGAAAGEG
jgi:uncharacterized membrane protein